MNTQQPSRYTSLDVSRKEIRLLRILSTETGNDLEAIHCTVICKSLKDVPVHQYVALSYVWGHELSEAPLMVDGLPMTITASLFNFLLRYRRISIAAPHWKLAGQDLWIDAICINQNDVEERNSQVQMMGQIYRSASSTIAWLGLEADDSSYVIAKMLDVFPKMNTAIQKKELVGWLDVEAKDLWLLNLERVDTTSFTSENRFWEGARRLLTREYWKRSWIAQELVLSKNVMLLCGQATLPLAALWIIWEWLLRVESLPCPQAVDPKLWSFLSTRSGRRLLSWGTLNKLPNLIDLSRLAARAPESDLPIIWREFVLHTRISQATDPRDKLYSVLGMLNRDISPDYSASIEDVFCDFAKRCILAENRLSVLCYAGHGMFFGTPEYPPHHLFVPSWVSNWDILSKEFSWGQFYHEQGGKRADGGRAPELVGLEGRILTVKGVSVDNIASRRRLTNDNNDWLAFCNDYLTTYAGPGVQGYVRGIPSLQALVRLLYLDKDPFREGTTSSMDSTALLRMAFLCGMVGRPETKVPAGRLLPSTLHDIYLDLIGPLNSEKDLEAVETVRAELLNTTRDASIQTRLTSIASTRLSLVMNYVAFWTSNGYLGWGPPGMELGDELCVLSGCEMPVVLRRVGERYIHVGPVWVIGLMDGEAMKALEEDTGLMRTFTIV